MPDKTQAVGESFLTARGNIRGPSGFLDTRFEQPSATIRNVSVSTPQELLALDVKRIDCL